MDGRLAGRWDRPVDDHRAVEVVRDTMRADRGLDSHSALGAERPEDQVTQVARNGQLAAAEGVSKAAGELRLMRVRAVGCPPSVGTASARHTCIRGARRCAVARSNGEVASRRGGR
jgi:hypothetical protein